MKIIIYIFIIAAALVIFLIYSIYQDITYIPEEYRGNQAGADKTEINLKALSKENPELNEEDIACLIKVFSVFYLNSINMPSDILESTGVDIEPGYINIEGVINFKKLDLDKVFSGNLSISLILLKIINPQRLFLSVIGNNKISEGKLYLDRESIVKIGKKSYKLFNLLENENKKDIFNKGIEIPPMLQIVKDIEYRQDYATLHLEN